MVVNREVIALIQVRAVIMNTTVGSQREWSAIQILDFKSVKVNLAVKKILAQVNMYVRHPNNIQHKKLLNWPIGRYFPTC